MLNIHNIQLTSTGRIRRNAEHFDDEGIFLGGEANDPQFSLRKGDRFFRLSSGGLEHNLWTFVALNDPAAEIGRKDTEVTGVAEPAYTFSLDGSGSITVVAQGFRNTAPGTFLSDARLRLVRNGLPVGDDEPVQLGSTVVTWAEVEVEGPEDVFELYVLAGQNNFGGQIIPVSCTAEWISIRARQELVRFS